MRVSQITDITKRAEYLKRAKKIEKNNDLRSYYEKPLFFAHGVTND